VNLTAIGLPGVPEIRNLIARVLLRPIARTRFVVGWLRWRCCHQAMAARGHYRRRGMEMQL
jgi:hypothetical protein